MILGGMTTEGAVRPAVSETREGTMREDTMIDGDILPVEVMAL